VQVDDIQEVVRRVALLGGSVLIGPFLVSDIAQVALVLDSAGATIGLWQTAAERWAVTRS
jgi:predicted enzyme related to lactoylglutathione lyase